MLGTESLVLATVAGVVASALTFRLPRMLMEWIIQRPVNFSLAPDWHVFAFLLVTTVAAALVAANAPIRSVLALDLNSTLRRVPDQARGRVEAREHAHERRDWRGGGAARGDDRAHAAAGAHRGFPAALRRAARVGDEPARAAARARAAGAAFTTTWRARWRR